MRKAAFLYNPDSGGSQKRPNDLHAALYELRAAGVDVDLFPTDSRHHAKDEARRAIDAGCDTIFACGGDGTIHNICQVVAHSPAALAILPMGTANALAHDINLPRNVVAAAKAALTAVPRRIALGRVNCLDLQGKPKERFFVVAAGVGVDAHLFYKLHTGTKQRMGMGAYYAKAWQLWFSYAMPRFVVESREAESREAGADTARRSEVTELMAVRIRNFGGVLRELAPGASLDRNDMRLVFCHTASRAAYLAYVTRGLLGRSWSVAGIELAYSTGVRCSYKPSAPERKIYVEADGELLGTLPAEITVVPDALTLLVP